MFGDDEESEGEETTDHNVEEQPFDVVSEMRKDGAFSESESEDTIEIESDIETDE